MYCYCSSNCCSDTISIALAVLSLACNITMIVIMLKQIKPEIQKLQQKFDDALERSKKRLIYERYFDTLGRPTNFSELVKLAYVDIMKLIPDTSDDYRQEDWLLAEWLIINRKYDTNIDMAEKERIRKLAKEISEIRRKK